MRRVFIDTAYFVGLINSKDQHHLLAKTAEQRMIGAELYTSQMVLVEVLTTFCKNEFLKKAAIEMIGTIADEIDVVDQTPELFDAAVVLYQNFGDKKWSLTDCASKVIMDELAIWEAATTDHHFIQMKRTILMV